MRKIVCLFAFLASLSPVFAQNLAGLDRWITDFPKGGGDFAGYRITQCIVERTGALIVINRNGLAVRLNLLKPVALAPLVALFRQTERELLDRDQLAAAGWTVVPRECDIDVGLKDELVVTLKLSSLRLRLNPGTVLELAGRLQGDAEFFRPPGAERFTYRLRFKGIDPGTGSRDAFPGWPECMKRLGAWFEQGIDAARQDVLAVVLETKVGRDGGKADERRIDRPAEAPTNLWIGMNVDYFMSHLVCAKSGTDGLNAYPLMYDLAQALVFFSWRNLGDPSWLVRPYRITLGLGGFFEFNARYFGMRDSGELALTGRPDVNASFMLAYGPVLRAEFSAMAPRIVEHRYAGDLIGFGLELLTIVNIPYFFPDYAYEYFLTQYLDFVVHLLPAPPGGGAAAGFDLVIGVTFAVATLDYDERNLDFIVDKLGLSLGARLAIDFGNVTVPAGNGR